MDSACCNPLQMFKELLLLLLVLVWQFHMPAKHAVTQGSLFVLTRSSNLLLLLVLKQL